jgi:hypothetical protein
MPRLKLILSFALAPLAAQTGSAPSFGAQLSQGAAQLLAPLIVTATVGALAAAVKALPLAFQWLQAHVVIKTHAAATATLQRALGIIEPIVLSAGQTVVDTVKADLANGIISHDTARKTLEDVKVNVVSQVKDELTSHAVLEDVAKVIGATDASSLESWIGTQVEAVLARRAKAVSP